MAGRKPGASKTGGRKAGTPNKKTTELLDKIEAFCKERGIEGYDPVIQMVEIANHDEADLPLKLNAAKEVAQYIHPKRKALEVDQAINDLVQLIIRK